MRKQSVTQRVTTGIVAAAACAVFVGGGIFIAQQAKQNRPEVANSGNDIAEQTNANFLGGTGEIHVAGTTEFMYDDTRVYFDFGHSCGSRNTEDLNVLQDTGDAVKNFLTHVYWDGDRFYYADGIALYRLNNDGTHENTPFFSADCYDGSADWNDFQYSDITHLTGSYYGVRMSHLNGSDYAVSYCLYNAETQQAELMPIDTGHIQFFAETDDSILLENPETGGMTRYTFSTKSRKEIRFNGYELANGKLLLRDHTLYGLMRKTAGASNALPQYCKVDLSTGNCAELIAAPPGISSFAACGDSIFTITKGMFLIESDPEFVQLNELCYYDDIRPERFSDIAAEEIDSVPMYYVVAADENYVAVRLGAGSDAERNLIYDRRENKPVFYYLNHAVQENPVDTTDGDTNLLGGTGTIRPVNGERASFTWLLRDDQYYYIHTDGNEERSWFRYPLEGGQGTMISSPVSNPPSNNMYAELVTDGTNILNRSLQQIVGGEMYPSMDEICEKLSPEAQEKKNLLECAGIWKIADKYFMWIAGREVDYDIYIWLDSSGNILDMQEYDDAQHTMGGVFCDQEHEHMYQTIDHEDIGRRQIDLIPMPGYPDESYTSPEEWAISSAVISGGKTLYSMWSETGKNQCELRLSDDDGSSILLANGNILSFNTRDDKVYYTVHDDSGSENAAYTIYMIDLQSDTHEPVAIYKSDSVTSVNAFTESSTPAGYEIVVYNSNQSVIFLDPDTYAVTRELSMPDASGMLAGDASDAD